MSNKPHLCPHQKKRQARRFTRLLVAILVVAFLALAIALEATGHIVFGERLWRSRSLGQRDDDVFRAGRLSAVACDRFQGERAWK